MAKNDPAGTAGRAIEDEKVEHAFIELRKAINEGLRLDPPHMRGLVERIRIELMLSRASRRRKAVYRAVIDLLEEEIEEKSGEGPDLSDQVVDYVRRLLQGLNQ